MKGLQAVLMRTCILKYCYKPHCVCIICICMCVCVRMCVCAVLSYSMTNAITVCMYSRNTTSAICNYMKLSPWFPPEVNSAINSWMCSTKHVDRTLKERKYPPPFTIFHIRATTLLTSRGKESFISMSNILSTITTKSCISIMAKTLPEHWYRPPPKGMKPLRNWLCSKSH